MNSKTNDLGANLHECLHRKKLSMGPLSGGGCTLTTLHQAKNIEKNAIDKFLKDSWAIK